MQRPCQINPLGRSLFSGRSSLRGQAPKSHSKDTTQTESHAGVVAKKLLLRNIRGHVFSKNGFKTLWFYCWFPNVNICSPQNRGLEFPNGTSTRTPGSISFPRLAEVRRAYGFLVIVPRTRVQPLWRFHPFMDPKRWFHFGTSM